MSFRDQALREMGLTPGWVRRQPVARDGSAGAGPVGSASGVVTGVVTGIAADAPARVVAADLLATRGAAPAPAAPQVCVPGDAAARLQALAAMSMDQLRATVDTCGACGLCATRRRAVFGAGPQAVPWMLVGEGPGADDEERGTPFQGTPGRLLDNMLAEAGLTRGQDVYITNAVKCRVPEHGRPDAVALAACRPHLLREIALVQPRLIVALGAVAAQVLLDTDVPVGSLRGQVHRRSFDGRDTAVVVTFHPSYVLRKLSEKGKSWEDLCLARQVLAS